eukprot:5546989-Pleurochrysis_carterae.AAC.1
MVNTPTQREPLGTTAPLGSRKPDGEPYSGLLYRVRMSPDPRLKHHHTPHRASGSGRISEATVPSGTEADDVSSPRRPRNLSPGWEEERRGPDLRVRTSEFPSPGEIGSQVPIEEGSEGVSAVPVPSGIDTADAPTKLSSYELLLLQQTRRVLEEIKL